MDKKIIFLSLTGCLATVLYFYWAGTIAMELIGYCVYLFAVAAICCSLHRY